STEASVLISGAAWVQPCGTDMLPTTDARPIDPATCAPVKPAEPRCGISPAIGANDPVMAFGPARYAAAPCPFWPHAYACPNDRNGPPGMEASPCREYGPEAIVDMIVFQFVRSVMSPGGTVTAASCGNARPDKNDPVEPCAPNPVTVVARFCSQVGTELI